MTLSFQLLLCTTIFFDCPFFLYTFNDLMSPKKQATNSSFNRRKFMQQKTNHQILNYYSILVLRHTWLCQLHPMQSISDKLELGDHGRIGFSPFSYPKYHVFLPLFMTMLSNNDDKSNLCSAYSENRSRVGVHRPVTGNQLSSFCDRNFFQLWRGD